MGKQIKQIDKDIYYDSIEIKPTNIESMREIELIILRKEKENEHKRDLQK